MNAAPLSLAVLALGSAIASTAIGQVLLKHYSATRAPLQIASAVVFFVLASASAYLALRTLSIDTVYMSTALTQILVLLASRWMFHEEIGRAHLQAMALILGGILVYNL